ncbi:MAG: EthD domain-containing protein [bacterium]|nr:EthD domain-containing protein [bacterium]
MQKLFYLLFDSAEADGTKLREALCGVAVPAMREAGAMEITVFGADADVAEGSPIRQVDPPIRAMVSFWLEDAGDRGSAEAALAGHVQGLAGYLVCESRPMVHEMPKGERTPGMKQISCITKRADLSQEEYIRIWHGDHRQVAIDTQSTFGYVRNEIFRALTPGAPDRWDAFVEESFPMGALTDQEIFYDAKTHEEYETNFKIMMDSCGRFLDHSAIEVTFFSEYYMG